MTPSLLEIEQLARQAGEILRAGFGKIHEIHYKGVIDVVTEIDKRSEDFLLGEIRKRYPNHRIFAEESGELPGERDFIWYVDPLDGTVNYTHGMPIYSVSIGYVEGGSPRLGCVYDPSRDECFTAERGRGAWLNGEPITASDVGDLDRSLLGTGFAYDIRSNENNNLDHFVRFATHTQAVRRLGSAALDLCYVAAGMFDGFWELHLEPWDVAAGILIAAEAGALVTDANGADVVLISPVSVVAANSKIHPQLLKGLRGEFKE
jgi:myo-inositol-1(or 4)-monophosphatase